MRSANVKSLTKIKEFSEDNFKIKLYYDSLSGCKPQSKTNEIENEVFPHLQRLYSTKRWKPADELKIYIYNNESDYKEYTERTTGYGHFDQASKKMYIYQRTNGTSIGDAIKIALNEVLLPKTDQVDLNDNLQVILHYNKLDSKKLKAIKQEIKDTFDEYEDRFVIEDHGPKKITFFLHDNKADYDKYGCTNPKGDANNERYCVGQVDPKNDTNILNAYHHVDGDDLPLRMQVSYVLNKHNTGTGYEMLPEREEFSNTEIQGNELEEEEVIDLSQYNLKVRIHYNDLSDDQLGAAEKEIKKTFSDFNKSFRLEKSNSPRELQLYIYDNRDDFTEHTGSDAAGIASPYWNGDNVAKMSIYKLDDDGVGFTEYLRHELTHGLTFYSNGSPGLTCGGKADYGLTSFLLEGIAYYIHEGSNLPGGSTFNPEDYYKDGHKLVSLLERCYPKVIDSIIHNNNLYKNALKHFKAEFPYPFRGVV